MHLLAELHGGRGCGTRAQRAAGCMQRTSSAREVLSSTPSSSTMNSMSAARSAPEIQAIAGWGEVGRPPWGDMQVRGCNGAPGAHTHG